MPWGLHNLTALSIASSEVSILRWVSTKAELVNRSTVYLLPATLFWQSFSRGSKMQPANTCTKTQHGASSCTPRDYESRQMHLFQEEQPLHSKKSLSHCAHSAYIHQQTRMQKLSARKSVIHVSPQSCTTGHLLDHLVSLLKHCLLLYMLRCQELTVRQDI